MKKRGNLSRAVGRAAIALLAAVALAGCSAEARRARAFERAAGYFSGGDYERAKVVYLTLLHETPGSAVVHERLGTIWLAQGAPVRALVHLRVAQEQSTGDAQVRAQIAEALRGSDRLAAAREEALAAVRATMVHGDALVLLSELVRSWTDHETVMAELRKSPVRTQAAGAVVRVNLLLARNEAEPAGAVLAAALKRWPDSAELQAARAVWQEKKGDLAAAAATWRRAAELAPRRSLVAARAAAFIGCHDGSAEALAWLRTAVDATPDFLPLRRELAHRLLRQRELEAAEEQVRAMLYQDNGNVEAWLLVAELHAARGERREAIARLGRLFSEQPTLALVAQRLGRALLQEGELDQAGTAVLAGLRHDPSHLDSRLLLAEIQLRRKHGPDAVRNLTQVLEDWPHEPRAQSLLAAALLEAGRPAEAVVILREKLRAQRGAPAVRLELAHALIRRGADDEAREHLEAVLAAEPGNIAAVTALVEREVRAGRFEAALQRLEPAPHGAPASAPRLSLTAAVHAARGAWAEAEAAAGRALAADAAHDRTYNVLKRIHDADPRGSRVPVLLGQVLVAEPRNPRALLLSALIHTERGELARAREAYELLLREQPDAPVPLNNLAALCAVEPALLDRAHELVTKARALQPDSPIVAATLGWVLCRRGDPAAALPLLAGAADQLPDHAEIQAHLAVVLGELGQTAAARAVWSKAAQSSGAFPGREQIAARLVTLAVAVPGAR